MRLICSLLLSAMLCTGLGVFAAGCAEPEDAGGGLPTASMKIGTKTYVLEIAARDAARQRGLMKRDSMPANHGMIFVFAKESRLRFWMHNTRIDLDIIFVSAQGRVDSVKTMHKYVEDETPSDGPALYAIELNAGEGAASGVKKGDALELPEKVLQSKADP